MLLVACTLAIMAATSTLPSDAPPQAPRPQYPSEEALRRYAQGRLLEERGQRDLALGEYSRALLLDDGSASLARRLSETSAIAGEPARSLEFAERALRIDPDDARALWLQGTALLNLNREREALAPLEAAAKGDSEKVEYLRTLGRAAESLDRLDIAVRRYRRGVWLDPDDVESWFQLAAGEARLGHFGAADTALAEVAEMNPLRPGVFFLQGWVQENLGHPQRAMDLYQEHLKIHPDDQVTRRRAVNLLAREKRFDEAWREVRVIARARPDDRETGEVEADLAFSAGRAAAGAQALQRLRRRWPDDPEVLAISVGVLARHDRAGQAVAEAEAWTAKRPDDFRAHLVAARARTLNREPDAALVHLRRAMVLAPDSLAPRAMLARFYDQQRRNDEAEKIWAETAQRFPGHNGVAFDLAACREKLGDLAGAEAAVRDVLRREPDHPTALNFLGYLWADHDRNLDQAVELIVRALAQDPDNGAYLDSLGWAYYRLGRLGEARVQLERAARLTGGDPVVLEHLGDVYKDLALKDLAREQYRLSLAADPGNARVRAKLDALH
ncbi:MAG: tetratricopeptide repeat protein [Candidatus Eisenbacteria bacterium]